MIAQRSFNLMPTVVKNLLIINGLFFLGMISIRSTFGIDITDWLGLYFPASSEFLPVQLVTHMFMHGNFGHIFSNMLMLWFLGSAMENHWGAKRFLTYYLLTGLGASALQIGVNAIEYFQLSAALESGALETITRDGKDLIERGFNYTNPTWGSFNRLLNAPNGRCLWRRIWRTSRLRHDLSKPSDLPQLSLPYQSKVFRHWVWLARTLQRVQCK